MSIYKDMYLNLLQNKNTFAIVRLLHTTNGSKTGRQIAKATNASPQATLNCLNRLEELRIVTAERVGRAKIYQLNQQHWFTTYVLIPFWEKISDWLSALVDYYLEHLPQKNNPLSIIVYGSFARNEEHLDSDLDLLFIFDSQYDLEKIAETLLALNANVYNTYAIHPSPQVISLADFQKSVKGKKGFARNIFLEGKTIYGLSPSEVINYDRKKN